MHLLLTPIAWGVPLRAVIQAGQRCIELQEAFRGLLTRLPGLRLTVPVSELRFKEKMAITSLHELPVTWDA
jgi:hypothetical protein